MDNTRTSNWPALVVFAGTMMILIGSFTMIQGFVAFFRPEYYVVGSNGLLVFDYNTWGWLMLGLGLLVAATGVGLLAGQTWARVVGIILCGINAIGQIAFLAAFPVWSVLVIALDIFAIYAIAAHGRALAEPGMGVEEEETKERRIA